MLKLSISGDTRVMPSSVSQISTTSGKGADRANDNDLSTHSKTNCVWDETLWYKMNFAVIHCFTRIVVINSHWTYRYRMQDAKVFVVDNDSQKETLCGTIRIRDVEGIEGQTYDISCDMTCGDEVKLTVYHETGNYKRGACITMAEIMAYISRFSPG